MSEDALVRAPPTLWVWPMFQSLQIGSEAIDWLRAKCPCSGLGRASGKRRKLRVGTSEIAPFDLFLEGLDLLLHALEAGIDIKRLAVGVQRVLVVADVLHDEAKAR